MSKFEFLRGEFEPRELTRPLEIHGADYLDITWAHEAEISGIRVTICRAPRYKPSICDCMQGEVPRSIRAGRTVRLIGGTWDRTYSIYNIRTGGWNHADSNTTMPLVIKLGQEDE